MLPPLDATDIARLLPHHGRMCLIERVLAWDAESIHCTADNHRAADHPLRWQNQLGSAIGIEYAAQAMALHGALRVPIQQPPRQGVITRVQQVHTTVDRLDTLARPLHIRAWRLMGDDTVVRYRFTLQHDDDTLLHGEASVLLAAPQGDLAR